MTTGTEDMTKDLDLFKTMADAGYLRLDIAQKIVTKCDATMKAKGYVPVSYQVAQIRWRVTDDYETRAEYYSNAEMNEAGRVTVGSSTYSDGLLYDKLTKLVLDVTTAERVEVVRKAQVMAKIKELSREAELVGIGQAYVTMLRETAEKMASNALAAPVNCEPANDGQLEEDDTPPF